MYTELEVQKKLDRVLKSVINMKATLTNDQPTLKAADAMADAIAKTIIDESIKEITEVLAEMKK